MPKTLEPLQPLLTKVTHVTLAIHIKKNHTPQQVAQDYFMLHYYHHLLKIYQEQEPHSEAILSAIGQIDWALNKLMLGKNQATLTKNNALLQAQEFLKQGVNENNVELVSAALTLGADIHQANSDGATIFDESCQNPRISSKILALLLDHKDGDICPLNCKKMTPLLLAVGTISDCNPDSLKKATLLLETMTEKNIVLSEIDVEALFKAAIKSGITAIDFLLNTGHKYTLQTLAHAILSADSRIIDFFVSDTTPEWIDGAKKIIQQQNQQYCDLFFYIAIGNVAQAKALLKSLKDKAGILDHNQELIDTALTLTIQIGRLRILALFFEMGVIDINYCIKSKQNMTPLELAVANNNFFIVKYLLLLHLTKPSHLTVDCKFDVRHMSMSTLFEKYSSQKKTGLICNRSKHEEPECLMQS